jgi:ABC-type nitrate/sulfonate/bicarbonate transport system permease component
MRRLLLRAGPAAVLLLLWELAARAGGSQFFPPPSKILGRVYVMWFSAGPANGVLTDAFWRDVVPSLTRAVSGWAIAAVIGIGLGIVAGSWEKAAGYIDPPITFLRSLPKPAIVPVFILVLGSSDAMRIGFIAFGCTWPILLNTVQGVRSVDPAFHDTARAYHIPVTTEFRRVVLPAAAPKIAAGMRISLSLSLILMVLSEWVLTDRGIGFFLLDAQRRFAILDLWAAIVLIGLIGYLVNIVFVAVEKRLMRWHAGLTSQR